MNMFREFIKDSSKAILFLTAGTAMSLFVTGAPDATFNAKCAMVGVWFVGVVYYEVMKCMIEGAID